jgi:hypothetical protein
MSPNLIRSTMEDFPEEFEWSLELRLNSPTNSRLNKLEREFCNSLKELAERMNQKLYMSETAVPRTHEADYYRLEINIVGLSNE